MIPLAQTEQLDQIDQLSFQKPVIIFKHSTRCSISQMALNRFEKAYATVEAETLPVYLLDLLNHRDVSNEIAIRYGVEHQSPQTLLIRDGKCTHDASHTEIDLFHIKETLN